MAERLPSQSASSLVEEPETTQPRRSNADLRVAAIVEELASKGEYRQAVSEVATIRDDDLHDQTVNLILRDLLASGDTDPELSDDLASSLRTAGARDDWLATALNDAISRGELDRAAVMVHSIQDPAFRDEALSGLVTEMVDAGDMQNAEAMAQLIKDPKLLADAWRVIGTASPDSAASAAQTESPLAESKSAVTEAPAEAAAKTGSDSAVEAESKGESSNSPPETPVQEHHGPAEDVDTVPAVSSDIEDGPDLLGRTADARAIAALLASADLEPPLAVGLFGAWGSGKTHFMHQVNTAIREFAGSGSAGYKHNVVPIWFNAWHYAEHNVWASILQHVWASLKPGPDQGEALLNDALAKVEGAQQIRLIAEERVQAATHAVEAAESARQEAQQTHDAAAGEIATLKAKDVWQQVKQELVMVDEKTGPAAAVQLQQLAEAVGVKAALANVEDATQTLAEVRAMTSRGSMLSLGRRDYRSPLFLGLLVVVVVAAVGLAAGAALHATDGWLASTVTWVTQVVAVVSGLAAVVGRQAGLVRKALRPAQRLQATLDDRQRELTEANLRELEQWEQRASAAQAELAAAAGQLAQAKQQEDAARVALDQLTGPRLLERYLSERASSADYQRYLGIVALAHRDLTRLVEYLAGAATDANATDVPQRIVLYIDDLDRCSPPTVVRVLEAVHLLLAIPLFAVVVGVDRRWLDESLERTHDVLFTAEPDQTPHTSARDYLDKIFHLTFTLPPITPRGAADMLMGSRSGLTAQQALHDAPAAGRRGGSVRNLASPPGDGPVARPAGVPAAQQRVSGARLAEAIQLTPSDTEALRRISVLIASSPRRVTRFLSTYLVVRARAAADPVMSHRLRDPVRHDEAVSSLAVLTALVFGIPSVGRALLNGELAAEKGTRSVREWLPEAAADVTAAEKRRLDAFLAAELARPDPRGADESEGPDEGNLLRLPVAALIYWLPLAGPYFRFALEEDHDHA